MNDALSVETPDEGPTLIAIDIDPRSVSIYAQPLTCRLDLERVFNTKSEARKAEPSIKPGSIGPQGQECLYTPDFKVELTGPVPLLVESKSDLDIERSKVILERRERILSALGFRYLVVPNSTFGHKGFHQNMVDVRDALRRMKKQDCKDALLKIGQVVDHLSGRFALGEIWNQVQPISDIHKAVAAGLLAYDLRAGKLSRDTEMWPAFGELSHLQILPLGD